MDQLGTDNNEIRSADLVSILSDKFRIERLDRFFKIETYQFQGITLRLDNSNSLLLRFDTLVDQFPDEYKGFTSYKLLLILNLYNETLDYYNVSLQNDLLSISESDDINHIVIWSLSSLPPEMTRVLKKWKTDVLHISSDDISQMQVVSTFVAKSADDLKYWLLLNRTADLLLKRLKKLFHLVLSEVAAPIYNKHYGSAKAATLDPVQRL